MSNQILVELFELCVKFHPQRILMSEGSAIPVPPVLLSKQESISLMKNWFARRPNFFRHSLINSLLPLQHRCDNFLLQKLPLREWRLKTTQIAHDSRVCFVAVNVYKHNENSRTWEHIRLRAQQNLLHCNAKRSEVEVTHVVNQHSVYQSPKT